MDEVEHLRLTDLNKSIYKNGNKRLNEYLRMQRKAWDALDQVSRLGKSRDAYDASVCCNEFKEISHLAMESKEPLFFSKIRNEVDKKLFQARVTSLEQLYLSLKQLRLFFFLRKIRLSKFQLTFC